MFRNLAIPMLLTLEGALTPSLSANEYSNISTVKNSLLPHQTSAILVAQQVLDIQQGGFIFSFRGCQNTPNSDQPLTCNFLIENTEEGRRELRIYSKSRVIDSDGNEILASSITIGNNTGNDARGVLSSGIPLRSSITFNKSPVGGIKLLELSLWEQGANYFYVEFRF